MKGLPHIGQSLKQHASKNVSKKFNTSRPEEMHQLLKILQKNPTTKGTCPMLKIGRRKTCLF